MKKWIVYLLGVITGIMITLIFAIYFNLSNNSGILELDLFEKPGDCMEYSQFEIFQVVESGGALAYADNSYGPIVFIIPNENQQFYDDQKIVLESDECAQHIGTLKYSTNMETEKTVPVIKIVEGVELQKSNRSFTDIKKSGKTLFDKIGDCVSRNNFEVQKVLESGDAIALEIQDEISGFVLTSDLEVLILAQNGINFYEKQIVKAPKGKIARQIGNYKYKENQNTKVIPIITFE